MNPDPEHAPSICRAIEKTIPSWLFRLARPPINRLGRARSNAPNFPGRVVRCVCLGEDRLLEGVHTFGSALSSLGRRGLAATQDMEEAFIGKAFSVCRRKRESTHADRVHRIYVLHTATEARTNEWSRTDRAITGWGCDPLASCIIPRVSKKRWWKSLIFSEKEKKKKRIPLLDALTF